MNKKYSYALFLCLLSLQYLILSSNIVIDDNLFITEQLIADSLTTGMLYCASDNIIIDTITSTGNVISIGNNTVPTIIQINNLPSTGSGELYLMIDPDSNLLYAASSSTPTPTPDTVTIENISTNVIMATENNLNINNTGGMTIFNAAKPNNSINITGSSINFTGPITTNNNESINFITDLSFFCPINTPQLTTNLLYINNSNIYPINISNNITFNNGITISTTSGLLIECVEIFFNDNVTIGTNQLNDVIRFITAVNLNPSFKNIPQDSSDNYNIEYITIIENFLQKRDLYTEQAFSIYTPPNSQLPMTSIGELNQTNIHFNTPMINNLSILNSNNSKINNLTINQKLLFNSENNTLSINNININNNTINCNYIDPINITINNLNLSNNNEISESILLILGNEKIYLPNLPIINENNTQINNATINNNMSLCKSQHTLTIDSQLLIQYMLNEKELTTKNNTMSPSQLKNILLNLLIDFRNSIEQTYKTLKIKSYTYIKKKNELEEKILLLSKIKNILINNTPGE